MTQPTLEQILEMEIKSFNTLKLGCEKAQTKGVYSFEESASIHQALTFYTTYLTQKKDAFTKAAESKGKLSPIQEETLEI